MQFAITPALLAPLFLASAAPSGAGDASSASAGDPTRLVPRDAVVYVQATSIDAVESSLRAIVGAIDADAAQKIDVRSVLLVAFGQGVEPKLIDGTRPLGIAIAISPKTMQPDVILILPTKSRDEFLRQLAALPRAPVVESDGDYVAWHSVKPAGPALGSEPNPFAQNLPQGIIAARVDLEKLIETYRPMIDMGLDQAEEMMSMAAESAPPSGMDLESLMSMYVDGARSVIDSAERLELAFAVQGSRVEISQSLTVLKDSDMEGWGSPEATGIEKAAYLIDPQASFAMLLGLDPARSLEHWKPLLESIFDAYPEPMRAAMTAQMKPADAFVKLMGKSHAVSGDLAHGELRLCYFISASDPAALIAEYGRMMSTPEMRKAGMTIEGPKEVEIGGVKAQQYRMKMSAEWLATFSVGDAGGAQAEAAQRVLQGLYGKDGVRITLAPKGGFLVMVLGGDDAYSSAAIARVSSGASQVPTWLGSSLATASGQSPCTVMRVDVGPIMRAVESMSAAESGSSKPNAVRAYPPFPIDFRAGISGRTWSSAWACDIRELAGFVKVVNAGRQLQLNRMRTSVDIRVLDVAVRNYQVNNDGKLPESLEILAVKDANGDSYLGRSELPRDPWGRPYVYTVDGSTYRIVSYGSDGNPGGEGDAADVDQSSESASDDASPFIYNIF